MIYKKVYINFPATIQGNKNINLSFLMLRQFTFFFCLQITYDFTLIFPKEGENIDINKERYCGAKVGG